MIGLISMMNTKKKILVAVFTLTALLFCSSAFAEETGKSIVDKASQRNSLGFESGRAEITLVIKDAKGVKQERKLDIKSKQVGGKNRTLITLLAPKDLQNQAFLFTENESKKNDIWMYLPAFKLTRRIEGSQKDASFLGSHFTYGDLQAENTDEGTYNRGKDAKVAGSDVYTVTAIPKKGSSPYDKIEMFIRKDDYIPIKNVFYANDTIKKTLYITKIGKTEKGKSYAKELVLKVPDGGSTVIKVDKIDESQIPDSTFSKEQLGK